MKKNLLLSFVLLICSVTLFSSCSKEEDTDIRDSYVGTYVGTISYTYGGTNYTGDITVNVTKSETANLIIIETEFYKNSTEFAKAEVKNGTFSTALTSSMDGVSETISVFNGTINNNEIKFSFSTTGYVTITVQAQKL